MYNGNDKVESDLINSYAWDTAIVFIEKYAAGKSNYANMKGTDFSTAEASTGKSGDVACNIYDMAANYAEWTTEHANYPYEGKNYYWVFRGGNYKYDSDYAAMRGVGVTESNNNLGFRTVLYLNEEEA